jgi:hypothetical protein
MWYTVVSILLWKLALFSKVHMSVYALENTYCVDNKFLLMNRPGCEAAKAPGRPLQSAPDLC